MSLKFSVQHTGARRENKAHVLLRHILRLPVYGCLAAFKSQPSELFTVMGWWRREGGVGGLSAVISAVL